MFERMGYVKDGKLYDYNSEISGIVKEKEAFMQSPASGLEVAINMWNGCLLVICPI